jgi:hypothetical protein
MFTVAEKNVLKHDRIFECYKFVSEYRFWIQLDVGAQEIRIRLEEDNRGKIHFTQSHFIHTPTLPCPYISNRTSEDTPEAALSAAVSTITTFYDRAIEDGYVPDSSWFIKNNFYY